MRKDVGETPEVSLMELARRASAEGDQQAWTAVQHSLQATVLAWLCAHPGRAVVRTEQDDQSFVDQVFAEAWQAVRQGQFAFQSLSEVLLLLWASLNGAILEAIRVSLHPRAVGKGMAVERDSEGYAHNPEFWNLLQAGLSDERERRLAYLLYHCGLQPAEIVRCCPQEWSDVHEVKRLRHIIFMQLIRKPKQ